MAVLGYMLTNCKLNEFTNKDSYPLPHIDDTLVRSGCWQVQLDDTSKEKTAFST